MGPRASQHDLLASAAVLLSGASWGLFWLPARWLAGQGLDSVWLAIWLFLISLAIIVPIGLWQWRALWKTEGSFLITGLFTGPAFSLYTVSLVATDVIHALLLFYISPAWATLIGWAIGGEPIRPRRLLALALAFAGLAVVLDVTSGVPLPRNLGDWLALAAGILWAYGSTRANRERDQIVTAPVIGFTAGGLAGALVLAFLPIAGLTLPPTADTLTATLPWVTVLSLAMFVPTTYLLLWSTQILNPGRVGILLMSEVVVGSVSAAILSGEPFGWREAIGALLIVGAGFIEVTGNAGRDPALSDRVV